MAEYSYLTDQIFTVSELLSADECTALIALAESQGFYDAPIHTAFGPQTRTDVRSNSRVMIDVADRATALWARTRDYVPTNDGLWTVCGLNERFRYYRYDIGQQFDWHFDGCYERETGERSRLTMLVYLNDDFEGGETSFESLSVQPKQGMALLFVHQIRHKGQPVIAGRKYVLRTDVMYRYRSPVRGVSP